MDLSITRDRITSFLDKVIFFFFITLVFFLPISNTGIEISFGAILLGMIARAAVRPPSFSDVKEFFKDKINFAVLIFYVCIGLSLLASGPELSKSFRAWITKWGEGVALFYFARIFLNEKRLRILIHVLLGAAFIVCLDGLYQKITGTDLLRGFTMNSAGNFLAIRASFNHFNNFATFLVVLFFINLGSFYDLKKNTAKVFSVCLTLLIMINLFFTYSRGAWLAFFMVCLLLVVFIPSRKIKWTFIPMLTFFLCAIIAVPALRERAMFIFQKGGDAQRFRFWGIAINMFKTSPIIGCGLGLFMDNFAKYSQSHPQYTHNCYLQLLAETGILGLGAFLWFIGNVLVTGLKRIRRQLDTLVLALLAAFAGFLVHAFFDTQLYSLKLSVLFWLLTALLVKSYDKDPSKACL